MLAVFMDMVVRPILYVASPKFRDHQARVRLQDAHLSGQLHATPDPTCSYCQAREQDRRDRRAR